MRETALRHVTRTATGSLLLGVGEGRTGAHVSPTRQASTHQMLECCMSVLAYTCADPVYRVFVASLVSVLYICADHANRVFVAPWFKRK